MAGGLCTSTTVYILLAIDMSLSFITTLKIVYYKKKGRFDDLTAAVQDLVLAEVTEITIPMLFTICFMLAYFGPNAEVLGNIKNSYFHYSAVVDIWASFRMLLIIMAIDASLLIVNFSTIYKFAKVNIFNVRDFVPVTNF